MDNAPKAGNSVETADVILRDDFELGDFGPAGGLFYKDNVEQRAGRAVFQGHNVHSGKTALTLVISPSEETPPHSSERAEVWEKPEILAAYDRVVWYGFALCLEKPVPRDDGRYVMAQWKREIIPGADRDFSPFMALRLYGGKLAITIETDLIESFTIGGHERPDGCHPGEARVWSRPTAHQTRALVAIESGTTLEEYPGYFNSCAPGIQVTRHADLPCAQKGWIDFVFRSNPGPAGDGHVEIFAEAVRISTIKGHIGHAGPGLGKNQYFKFGPYRAPDARDWSVSYDNFRRGPQCADVFLAAAASSSSLISLLLLPRIHIRPVEPIKRISLHVAQLRVEPAVREVQREVQHVQRDIDGMGDRYLATPHPHPAMKRLGLLLHLLRLVRRHAALGSLHHHSDLLNPRRPAAPLREPPAKETPRRRRVPVKRHCRQVPKQHADCLASISLGFVEHSVDVGLGDC
jgi:hypothetical protein